MKADQTVNNVDIIQDVLNQGSFTHLPSLVNKGLSNSQLVQLLESTLPEERTIIWQFINDKRKSSVLQYLGEDIRNDLLSSMKPQQLVHALSDMETDNMADILQQMPNRVINQVFNLMSNQDKERVEKVISYPEDSAGGLMNTDMVTIRPDISVDVVKRFLRRTRVPERTDRIYVTNTKGQLVGVLPIATILIEAPETMVSTLISKDYISVQPLDKAEKIALLFQRERLISLPVVDENNVLLGRITFDDVLAIIYETGVNSRVAMVQVDEEADTYASVKRSITGRMIWLAINLATAFIGSAVIGIFEDSIEKVVALAVLLPIVASMGGIAGTQTLTIMIRGLALGQIQGSRLGWLLNREVQLALACGAILSLVIGLSVFFWFNDSLLGLIISIAIIINLITAGITGVFLPFVLRMLRIDPALAGGVVLTTVTDVVGFASFLGLATVFYA